MAAPATDNLRVSAVISAYNCAAFVGEAIVSVLMQTRPLDEIVVVDDGSSDATADVVASYAAAGVRYVRQEHQGANVARNRGIAETTGELIAFLDGDDLWLPEKTAQQAAYLAAHADVALVSGDMWWWDVEDNRRVLEHFGVASDADIMRELVVRNVVGNTSLGMLRRCVLDETGLFDPALRWGQEWELWMRIAGRARIGFIPAPLIVYRSHHANLSHSNRWERLAALFAISRQGISRFQPLWRRPVLLARAWSVAEHQRALYAATHGFARWRQLCHAGLALLAYPFDTPAEKASTLLRAIVGESLYEHIRAHSSAAGVRRIDDRRRGEQLASYDGQETEAA